MPRAGPILAPAATAGPAVNAVPLPCVIDVEASGFGRGSYPIEVGFVLPDGESVCTLVQPAPHWQHWDGAAEHLHGITRDVLARHGKPPREVAELLNSRLRGATIYCDSWAHDYAWLAILFDEAGLTPSFKLRHLHELLDDQAAAHWDGACAEVRNSLQLQRHRASTDARVLQLALARVREGQAAPIVPPSPEAA
ncbi:hypothetical protein LRH25_24755 [Ideonella azotifigens]|uniref:Exonuclease domain-containing protein n=2 Tax=Ideonella azotifigens TaxID=513160 RepID=A0ABN1JI20_9BURK|nr:hypothetical protein [Ideonella azotifigens]MCD2343542.1 hypothetical protein [Ideonella azotifigens]